MKAITYSRYGTPDVLGLEDIPKPEPRPNEVCVRVHAVEVTKADCELRSFRFPVRWFWLPLRLALGVRRPRRRVLGSYIAGVVESCGAEVTEFAVGDEVYGGTGLRLGGYGEFVCVPQSATLVPKPSNMSFAEAAAVPLGGLNALHFMRKAGLQAGARVLINGAGGSIGLHALQIAKAAGARVTVVDAGHKEALLRGFGADEFVDYTVEKFTERGGTYDVVFDMVPSSPYRACLRLLDRGGRYLSGNPRLSTLLRAGPTSWWTDKNATCAFARETREELEALTQKIEAGEIRSIVDTVYPMEQIAEAHRRVESEQRLGAVVVEIG